MTTLRRLAAVLTTLTMLVGLAAIAPRAEAQTSADKRAEAERVATELEQLRIQASQLDEQHHQATLELEGAQRDILEAEARVDDLEAQFGVQQARLEEYAVQAYMGGDAQPSIDAFLESNEPNELGTKVAYLGVTTGDQQDLIDGLQGARAELDAEVANLAQAEADAEQFEADARTALAGAQQAVADQEAIYARVQGEAAELLAQEEARQAEERRRRAEEEARLRAEEEREQEPPAAPDPVDIVETNDDPPSTPPTTEAPDPEDPEIPDVDVPTGATPGADVAVATAYSLLGTPYVWAGSTPASGFDCSGFTAYVWGQAGRSLPHSAAAQGAMVRRLPLSQLLPGDLVFYGFGYVHHVALYVGGGTIIHAPRAGDVVRVDSIYYWDDLHWAGRLP
jgi:cell wall-associated NlpC family hydrolase